MGTHTAVTAGYDDDTQRELADLGAWPGDGWTLADTLALPARCLLHDRDLRVAPHAGRLRGVGTYFVAVGLECPACARPVILLNQWDIPRGTACFYGPAAYWDRTLREAMESRAAELRAMALLCFHQHVRNDWRAYDLLAPGGSGLTLDELADWCAGELEPLP